MAENNRIKVSLDFSANTSQAKQSILDLQNTLSKIASADAFEGSTQSLQAASSAAKELSLHLNNAYNANTGKLDLSKFNKSLASSKTNLSELSAKLTSIGPEGQKAFIQLAQSVAAAERPVVTLNSKISSMVQTLTNTIRWQIASNAVHKFESAIAGAVSYAEDLNESLTNIRIVSNQNTEQMAKFAEQANKAAKALSSTTLDYTNASLIYYQQGLSDKEVQDRTEVTIKMANAAGESAQIVSDQLTAVWNNFYDGSKSLEYYADVMTKLGAATASSTDEIAEGLEKFAAIADTVGLSYEYATAALATVTSNTRQSADVVGTAFKTIFARMQDLELGNTLDDGTTLGTYSQAMEKVGISVLDTNGNLIAMDDILDSMAEKWETLSDAQQVSLAQSVAGVRQYNQLISLMDNWNKTDADSMISNLGYVENAEGTLQEQADIYAESWEAASNRVTTSIQAIYSDIIDDKFFIKLLNFLSEGLDSVDALIDGLGGIKPVLVGIVGYLTSAMSTSIGPAIQSIRSNLEIVFTGKSQSALNASQKMSSAIDAELNNAALNESDRLSLQLAKELNDAKRKYNEIENDLTPIEKMRYQMQLNILQTQQEETKELQQQVQLAEEARMAADEDVYEAPGAFNINLYDKFDATKAAQKASGNLNGMYQLMQNRTNAAKAQYLLHEADDPTGVYYDNFRALQQSTEEYYNLFVSRAEEAGAEAAHLLINAFTKMTANNETSISNLFHLDALPNRMKTVISEVQVAMEQVNTSGNMSDLITPEMRVDLLEYVEVLKAATLGTSEFEDLTKSINSESSTWGDVLKQIKDIPVELDKITLSAEQIRDVFKLLGQGKTVDEIVKKFQVLREAEADAKEKAEAYKAILEKIKVVNNSFDPKHIASLSESFLKMASSVTMAYSAFNGFKSAFSALNNEDLSILEKSLTFLSGISMASMSSINAIKNFNIAIAGLNSRLAGYIVTQTLVNNQTAIATAATELYASKANNLNRTKAMQKLVDQGLITQEQKLNLAKDVGIIKTEISDKAQAKDAISKTINAYATEHLEKQTKKGLAVKIIDALYTKLCTSATNADTIATNLNTAAKLKAVAVAILTNPVTWIAVAATTALTVAIWAGVKAYNADAEAAEKAKEASEHFSDALNESKQELDDITSAFDNYKSLVDALNECEEGTEEWNEALEDVKDSIWDILEAYPDLAKQKDIFNDDGTLNQDTVNSYIADKKKIVNSQRAMSLTASAQAAQAQNKSDITDTSRSIANKATNYFDTSGNFPINEYSVKNFLNSTIDKLNSEDLDDQNYNQILEQSINKYVDSLGLMSDQSDSFKEDLWESANSIRDLANASAEASTQMQNVGKILAGEVLGDDVTTEQTSKYGEDYEAVYQSAYNDAIEQTKTGINRWSGKNDEEVKAILKEYNELMGTNYTLDSNAVTGNDFNRGFQLIDENGEIFKLTAEMFANAKASNAAQEGASEAARQDLTNQLNFGELDLSSAISDEVDLSLVNSLVQSLQLSDETTQEALSGLLNSSQSALEQTKIIQELLDSIPSEEKERAEIASLRSNAVSKYELDSEEIELQAEALQELYGAERLTEKQATKLAIENQRMNKGVESLVDNWEDWNAELKAGQLDKAKKGTIDYTRTIRDLTTTIADLVGASEELELSNEFFDSAENLDLINKAAQGSTDAINQLGISVAKDQLNNLKMDYKYQGSDGSFAMWKDEDGDWIVQTEEKFNSYKETVLNGMAELQNKLAEGNDLTGQSLEEILDAGGTSAEEWANALNQMALATNMSVDEMNSMLSSMGLEADLDVTYKTIKSKKPITRTIIVPDEVDGYDEYGNLKNYTTQTFTDGYSEVNETIAIPQITTNGATGKPVSVNYIGNGSVSPSAKGNGSSSSSSKPSKKDYTKKSEVVERYKEQNDILEDIEDSLDRISKAADRAFGADKIKQLKKEQELYLQQKDALQAKLDLANKYYNSDKQALVDEAAKYGITFDFDTDTGNITNYTTIMTQLYNELHNAETKYNGLGTKDAQESYEESTLEPIQDKIDALEDLISQYEETKELTQELKDSIQEAFYAWQDANYEELEYKLELKLDIDDSKIQELEFLLTQYGDNFYKRAEAAVAMMDKVPVYEDLLGTYEEHQEELNQKYAAGKISQADYIDGLKKIRDGYYEQLEALIALDEEMMTYYEDTLAAATSKLEDYTDHMEHLTSVFEHYTNLMEILGKQKDYDAMGDFLGGKAETLRDRLDIAKQYYQILQDQRVEAEKALALANNDEERELLEKNLDAIIDEVDAAEDEVLSLTEEWAEAMKAVIENEMASIADTLEKALTNGLGFDNLMDSFDKLNTRQEEYLTKTNQIYETNKLMRTASKALDETDNKVAKQKLQNFIDETQSLQEQTQLSEYELEIQQAKYDLLLAEIALEEAQNAKSTVRLSRDNEGNFGYVYTADQDAIDDAQQELDDAKNSLYNLSLEGQQDYTDKYLQAQQEMYEALTELQQQYLDGEIASEEEYQRRTEEILYHYYNPDDGVLTTYSKLYNVAVRTDADATADYWAKDYGAMTQNTADWYEAVNEYLIQIEEQTNTWKEVSEAANEDVQGALDNSSEATERLTEESEALKEMLEDEVLDAIEDEIDAVREQTEAYAEQRQELQNLIATYKAYISALNSQIKSASSTSSGSSDYSYLMTEAYLNGDTDAYNTAAANRADKLVSGNYSSVDQDRLEGVFAAANNGNEKAQELIGKVYDKKLQYTDSTLKQYGFDTGGYTGEWGPEGKLAFLHQKELVLNQDDTENLLTAVSFIRELVNVIDSKASLASLFNLSSAGVANSSSALEQNVHIEASFPNATNHSEIEEAFENLVNKASQYANRK